MNRRAMRATSVRVGVGFGWLDREEEDVEEEEEEAYEGGGGGGVFGFA